MVTSDEPQVILYFGNDWSAENRTSSHHIATWLAGRHQVYYLECPGMRAPTGSKRDLRKIWTKVWRFLRGPRAVNENLKVWTLMQIPLHRFRVVQACNRGLLRLAVRWLMWREGIQQPISWFMIPHVSSLAKKLGESVCVYYVTDDHAALPGVNVAKIESMDEELTRQADVVFVASETLYEKKRLVNANTHVSPHGVDVEHFGRAQSKELSIPADVAHLPRPVIGFYGLIERWIDLDLVAYLAEQRPEWTFLMIGRLAVPANEVPSRPNMHFIGKRDYCELPAYGKLFDVAIIPYRHNDQVFHANPLKLREYLAMGKPIVSVSTPQIDKFSDVVSIASSREEFLSMIDRVLQASADEQAGDVWKRMQRVASTSWDARLQAVWDIVAACPQEPTTHEPQTISVQHTSAKSIAVLTSASAADRHSSLSRHARAGSKQ